MLMATRLLYLLSGVIALATGIYVEVRFVEVLPDWSRWLSACGAIAYFLSQLYRLLATEYPRLRRHPSMELPQEY